MACGCSLLYSFPFFSFFFVCLFFFLFFFCTSGNVHKTLELVSKTADSLCDGDLVERHIRSGGQWSLLPTQVNRPIDNLSSSSAALPLCPCPAFVCFVLVFLFCVFILPTNSIAFLKSLCGFAAPFVFIPLPLFLSLNSVSIFSLVSSLSSSFLAFLLRLFLKNKLLSSIVHYILPTFSNFSTFHPYFLFFFSSPFLGFFLGYLLPPPPPIFSRFFIKNTGLSN